MSFRGRLLVFFTIIVVIPMIAVALVLFSLTADSEHGKVDARLAERAADGARRSTRRAARTRAASLARVAADDELTQALRSGRRGRGRSTPARAGRRRSRASSRSPTPRRAGSWPPRPARRRRRGGDACSRRRRTGERLGTLAVSVTSADELARKSARFTGLDVRVLRGDRVLATTISGAREPGRRLRRRRPSRARSTARACRTSARRPARRRASTCSRTRPRCRTRSPRAGC